MSAAKPSGPKLEIFQPGQTIYAVLRDRGWMIGTVRAVTADGGKCDVVFDGEPAAVSVPVAQCHAILPNAYNGENPDLFRVEDLHLATLLFCLKDRFEKRHQQYSRMGGMILSVNPFRRMPFNGDEERVRYLAAASDTGALPPHVWSIGAKAYHEVCVRNQNSQSVVISGESGSGKTENTKLVIAYLGELSLRHSCNPVQRSTVERINERLRCSNPILESFGNARTVRNDNSSRFGKYIKLFFEPSSGIMTGGEMVTYLLEKSRVCFVAQGERNYHVFYEMLAGLTPEQRQALGNLGEAKNYPCLAAGGQLRRRGTDGADVNDAHEFQTLADAMTKMGLSATRQMTIWTVLAAILHLSLLKFVTGSDDKAKVEDRQPIVTACGLLGVDAAELERCFLEKSRTAIMTSLCTVTEAEAFRDSFCKCLYVGVFDYLVSVVNESIKGASSTAGAKYIGILDIFGFENFAKNSFEQLCINFANEALQNQYNKFTFLNDKQECDAEGIECPHVVAPDNALCVSMIEDNRKGLFAFLDEQCYTRGGTAANFTTNAWEALKDNPCFVRPKSSVPTAFGVRHYAAEVTYATDGWLAKNSDPLRDETRDCVRRSKYAADAQFVQTLLDGAETMGGVTAAGAAPKKRSSVSSRFREQLASLRRELESTEPHYVRCVKPNPLAQPLALDNGHVTAQLESAGVLQTIALKRQGYPLRRPHETFARFFHSIAPAKTMRALIAQGNFKEACQTVLALYTRVCGWKPPHWAIGRGKVFVRPEVWAAMERTLLSRNRRRVKRCAPHLRRWVARFRARKAAELERRKAQEALEARTRRVASGANLTHDQLTWFEELARVFHKLDCEVVYDVVGAFKQKEAAAAALANIQGQQWDKNLAANLVRTVKELRLRPEVALALSQGGIDTVAKLYALSEADQERLGFSAVERDNLAALIVQQESDMIRNERLKASGTGEISPDELAGLLRAAAAPEAAAAAPTVVRSRAVQELMDTLGVPEQRAELALKKANGNPSVAASLILDGADLSERPPPPQQRPPPAAAAPPRGPMPAAPSVQVPSATVPATRPAPPVSAHSPPMVAGQPRPPAPYVTQPSLPPGVQWGIPAPHYAGGPPSSSQAAPVMGTPIAGPHYSGGNPTHPPPGRPTAPPQPSAFNADPAKVDKLVNMGFPRERAVQALVQTGGDVQRAVDVLFASA